MNNFFTREGGQARQRWLDEKAQNALDAAQYYIGPSIPVNQLAELAGMLNPINDLYHMQSATRRAIEAEPGERFPHVMDAATNALTFMAPVVGGAIGSRMAQRAGGSLVDDGARAANALAETFTNTSQAGKRAARDFAADQSGALRTTPRAADDIEASLRSAYPDLKLSIRSGADNSIELSRIEVPATQRDQGIGTRAMQDLLREADARGLQVNLTPSADFGGNVSRLKRFYKRLGFQENKGRNRDFSTRESMIRPAQIGAGANETPAQEVARMLREGRSAEVTDDMMARVDPQEMYRLYESGATGRAMPMDTPSRMARAESMGANPMEDFYHGTVREGFVDTTDIVSFDPKRVGDRWNADSQGFSMTSSARDANYYATRSDSSKGNLGDGAVYPLMDMSKKPLDMRVGPLDGTISAWDSRPPDTYDVLRAGGYDAVDLRADGVHMRVSMDPTNIRSRFARFDPRLSHLANLSASAGGLGVLVDRLGIEGAAAMLGMSASEVEAAMQPQQPQGLLSQ